jgi:hypothetical protein
MKKLNTILIGILFSAVLNAQTNDAQLWSWVSVNKKVAKDLVGTLEQQVRLDHNMSFPKNIFTEMRMGYRLNKHIKYTISYRFMNRGQAEGGFVSGNRFTGDLRLRYKSKPFILFYRNRMQREYRMEEEGIEQINYTRNKLALALDLDKKFSPYASFEIYYHLNKAEFNKNRYTLGVEFDLRNRNELEVFYRIQQDYNVNGRETAYVIGIGFSHSLKGMLFK